MHFARIMMVCALGAGLTMGQSAVGANLAKGKYLYENSTPLSCSAPTSCHGINPSLDLNKIKLGINAAVTKAAINGTVPLMGIYQTLNTPGKLSDADLSDIATYIQTPTAGAILALSNTALSFGTVAFGSSPPAQVITITNTGLANLTVTSTSGVNATDYTVTNNCNAAVSATPNGTGACTINIAINTTSSGSKPATLTIASNAGANQTVTLSGTVGSGPTVSLNAPSGGLTFPNTVAGDTSNANSGAVTLTNTGAAPLTFSELKSPPDFGLNQTLPTSCKVGTAVAASQTCTITVTFTPSSAGAKSGNFTITSNAGTNLIALSGTGTPASQPTPIASLDSSSLSFGNQTLGVASTQQQITLTNTGTLPLVITNIADSSGEFVRTGSCIINGQIPAAASCTIIVVFQPNSIGAKNATIIITDNANNTPGTTQTINLSGTGAALLLSAPTLELASLDFTSQSLNTPSAAKSVTITNTSSTNGLNISEISKAGTNASEYTIDSNVANACSTASPVAASGSCVISVTFLPTAAGAREASIGIATNATGSPHTISLTGTGSAISGPPAVAGPSTNVGGGGCAIQTRGSFDPVLLALFLLSLMGLFAKQMRNRNRLEVQIQSTRSRRSNNANFN